MTKNTNKVPQTKAEISTVAQAAQLDEVLKAAGAPAEGAPAEGAPKDDGSSAPQEKSAEPWKLGEKAYVRAVHGSLTHMISNKVIGEDPVKVEIDAFVALQLRAGKLAVAD